MKRSSFSRASGTGFSLTRRRRNLRQRAHTTQALPPGLLAQMAAGWWRARRLSWGCISLATTAMAATERLAFRTLRLTLMAHLLRSAITSHSLLSNIKRRSWLSTLMAVASMRPAVELQQQGSGGGVRLAAVC